MNGEYAVVTQENRPIFIGSRRGCKDFVRLVRRANNQEGADFMKVVPAASVRREVREK